MMYPILCKVRYESLHDVFRHRQIWKQIGFSIFINWIVAPFFMVCHSPMTYDAWPCRLSAPPESLFHANSDNV